MDSRIENSSNQHLALLNFAFQRYLFPRLDLKWRLTGITGARGTGKTTLLLQALKLFSESGGKGLYVSLDDLYFSENKLVDFARQYHREGGQVLFLDEVHKYPGWSQELKNIYDSIPGVNVLFTSSSALEIYRGGYDLSRRVLVHKLWGLSFREFLALKYQLDFPSLSLREILSHNHSLYNLLNQTFRPYQYFKEYLQTGYYPFIMEGENVYYERLLRSTLQVLESDLPAIFAMDYSSVQNLKKLLYLLASMVPFKPNISRLALQLGVTRSTLLHYLEMLDRAQILSLLSSEADGINYLNKPEKIYLNNTNLMYGLNPMLVNTGSMRETFFYNQLSCLHKIHYTSAGDFLVDRTWSFETGGRSKGERQIKNIPHAFLVKDDIEYGHGNIIPLWVFGFLY